MKTHNLKTLKYLIALLALVGVSCSEPLPVVNTMNSGNLLEAGVKKLDPDDAVATLSSKSVRMDVLEGSDGIRVPTFDITRKDAEFVGVIRCKADYELKSSTGESIDELGEYTKYEDMKWMWNKASGEFTQCKFLGTHVYRNKIQDIAAVSGSYYYILNPCVSKKRSTTGKEGCSNDLQITNAITFESEMQQSFIQAAQQLSELEIEVGGAAARIKSLAEVIQAEQQACEKVAAIKASNMGFFRGVASLAGAVVGGVVGSIMGGPVGAVQGATSFMGIARDLVNKYGPKVKMDCSGADEYRNELANEVATMEITVGYVIEARNKMASINSDYRRLNELIESETSAK